MVCVFRFYGWYLILLFRYDTSFSGKLPTPQEYQNYSAKIQETAADTFRYMNFDRLGDYVKVGETADLGSEYKSNLDKEVEKLKTYAK